MAVDHGPAAFLARHKPAVSVTVSVAEGSTPREKGAAMLVSADALWGTIGGGRLELMAIEKARALLASEPDCSETMDVPLGPEIGQCCGGRVKLVLEQVDAAAALSLELDWRDALRHRPHVHVFGAGHVGKALFRQLEPLPIRRHLIDSRPEAVAGLADDDDVRVLAMPETAIAEAPAGSAFIILTHDHGQDFLLASAALSRGDAAYVGMIGSATKRATFASYWRKQGGEAGQLAEFKCPIGGSMLDDKRPEVIAAMTIGEMLPVLLGGGTGPEGRT